MATLDLEARVARLEAEVKQLKEERPTTATQIPWWERIRGTFKNDPAYIEAMQLGRDWRQSEPPESEENAS